MKSKTTLLRYRDSEAHIVRRLGAAVVSIWNDLPNNYREKIQHRALDVHDEYQTVQLNEQILRFISEHAGER